MKSRPSARPAMLPALFACALLVAPLAAESSAAPLKQTIVEGQSKIVKIYGAGGFRGLEAYQTGFLASPDGHIVTVWSYVLDTDFITCVLDDGRRFEAKLLGADPRLELAVLKIEADNLPHFPLEVTAKAEAGTRILAFSNLYGIASGEEPASVQMGTVSVVTQLAARRGVWETTYRGPVYVLDAITNNPGAAGGALTDRQGRLLGMLGKELRNTLSNTWLNYAIPLEEMKPSVEAIIEGRSVEEVGPRDLRPEDAMGLEMLGVVLVPNVLDRTPPFIDVVRPDSPADRAGVRPDDLILFINERLIQSIDQLRDDLARIDRSTEIKLTVSRNQELMDFTLKAE